MAKFLGILVPIPPKLPHSNKCKLQSIAIGLVVRMEFQSIVPADMDPSLRFRSREGRPVNMSSLIE